MSDNDDAIIENKQGGVEEQGKMKIETEADEDVDQHLPNGNPTALYNGGVEGNHLDPETYRDRTLSRLQSELCRAQSELKLKDKEVARLSKIRDNVESELEELTANLFQEAHRMVGEANSSRMVSERLLREAQMKVDVLEAEVSALKTLVLTSTPSAPNPHLHPHIQSATTDNWHTASFWERQLALLTSILPVLEGVKLFPRGHRRSPSLQNMKYGRDNTPPGSPLKGGSPPSTPYRHPQQTIPPVDPDLDPDQWEVDPVLHKEFVSWRENPVLDPSNPFLARIYTEDINRCLDFQNKRLAKKVKEAIQNNSICIEAVGTKGTFPKKCALLETPRLCKYRLKLEDEEWVYISPLCRNRIASVCDFLNYLRYIQLGLVKSSINEAYWETMRLRKKMSVSLLGMG